MKSYYWVGSHIEYAEQLFADDFIGLNAVDEDFSSLLHEGERMFRRQAANLFPSVQAAGTGVAAMDEFWDFAKHLRIGDIIFYPPGWGRSCRVAVVSGDYFHLRGAHLPHRRPVRWLPLLALRGMPILGFPHNGTSSSVRFSIYDWAGGAAVVSGEFQADFQEGVVAINGSAATHLTLERAQRQQSRYLRPIGGITFAVAAGMKLESGMSAILSVGGGADPLRRCWALAVVPPLAHFAGGLFRELVGVADL